MCGSMVDIQSLTAEIRQGKEEEEEEEKEEEEEEEEKEEEEEEEETTARKYIWPALLHRAAIKNVDKLQTLFTCSTG